MADFPQPTPHPADNALKRFGEIPRNTLGMQFALIPAGAFQMGSAAYELDRCNDELPHAVTLSEPFLMSMHPVTRGQFTEFINASGYKTQAEQIGWAYGWSADKWDKEIGASWRTPGYDQGDDHPVVCVNWNDAQAFIKWLCKREGEPYSLPTEAQWEYACRAGTSTPFHFGETLSSMSANYNGAGVYGPGRIGDFRQKTTPVGSFECNAYGLHDMHGNVWEWCADWYGAYPLGEAVDPVGAAGGALRVLRGGSWGNYPRCCRSAFRFRNMADCRLCDVGFRLCQHLV